MDSEQDFTEYRERLLKGMREGIHRSSRGAVDPIQIFVNQRRVGMLDGVGAGATFQVKSETHIDSVHLRSEDGVLLGGLSAPECGDRSSRISLTRGIVDLRVHNTAQGGSVRAVCIPAPNLWHRARRVLADMTDDAARPVTFLGSGVRAIAFTQVLLAVAIVGLVADRIIDWVAPTGPPPQVTQMEAPWAAPLAQVAKLEQQLTELSQMQAKVVETIQMQQQGMAQFQRTMAKLTSTHETVASNLLTVKQEMEQRRKGAGRDADRMTRVIMSRAHSEQEQLEAEIHSLTVANDRLSKEMAELEQHNQDLKKRLQSAGQDVSKATVSDHDKPMVARQSDVTQSPQVAEARPHPQSFHFLVTFREGTDQKSIDWWVHEMQGYIRDTYKGAVSEGWRSPSRRFRLIDSWNGWSRL